MFVSDGIHFSNCAGDKTEWPVYMTIGDVSSMIHQMPSIYDVVMVALLPSPAKNRNIPSAQLDKQQ
jgi:hypothetical protein